MTGPAETGPAETGPAGELAAHAFDHAWYSSFLDQVRGPGQAIAVREPACPQRLPAPG